MDSMAKPPDVNMHDDAGETEGGAVVLSEEECCGTGRISGSWWLGTGGMGTKMEVNEWSRMCGGPSFLPLPLDRLGDEGAGIGSVLD